MIKRTCHFRQLGLKDGELIWASFSWANMYRVLTARSMGFRCGNWLAGYVIRGNLSKRRLIGLGVVSHGERAGVR